MKSEIPPQGGSEEEKEYRERVMEQRIQNLLNEFRTIEEGVRTIGERVDYQSLSKGEFMDFENSFAKFSADVSLTFHEAFHGLSEKHGVKKGSMEGEKSPDKEE